MSHVQRGLAEHKNGVSDPRAAAGEVCACFQGPSCPMDPFRHSQEASPQGNSGPRTVPMEEPWSSSGPPSCQLRQVAGSRRGQLFQKRVGSCETINPQNLSSTSTERSKPLTGRSLIFCEHTEFGTEVTSTFNIRIIIVPWTEL